LIAFDDSLANGQPNTGSGMFGGRVEALEQPEDLLLVFRFDADSVVPYRNDPMIFLPSGCSWTR
jgi:hypothetical protein